MTTSIPTNRDTFERNQPQQVGANTPNGGIQVALFGGLNTVSNPLAIPYEDSPLLVNANVNVSGCIEKRRGSRVVRSETTAARGMTTIPVTTVLGYNFLVVKNGRDLQVMELVGNSLLLRMTKTNVWSSLAESVKATYVSTNEPEQRLILCTGFNVPIQLTFTERRLLTTGGTATVSIPNADTLATASTTNTLVYVDGVLTSVSSYSYNTTTKTLTITLASSMASGNRVVDVELITWQWWAEALFYYGDRFFDTATRFNEKPGDRHVPIPENLRDGIEPTPVYPNLFPINVLRYERPNYVYYTSNASRAPLGAFQYAFSDGTVPPPLSVSFRGMVNNGQTTFTFTTPAENSLDWQYANTSNTFVTFNSTIQTISSISWANNTLTVTLASGVTSSGKPDIVQVLLNVTPIVPAPFFVTFGTIMPPPPSAQQITLYMSRLRPLPFNGGNGITGNDLHVRRDNVVQSQYTGGSSPSNYGDYQLYDLTSSISPLTSTSALARFIDFTGNAEIGVPANARIRIVNKAVPTSYVGSSATSSNAARTDGSWVPCYGLSSFANYATGSFPRNVALYQGRLVFSGFPQNPLAVAFSSVDDNTVPGEYYASFQIDAMTTKASDPLDVRIPSSSDDIVTGLAEHQGYLFVFTRKGLYRIGASGRNNITADNAVVSSIASKGTPNPFCLVKAQDSLVFLSDDGVYIVTNDTTSQDVSEYKLDELSTKVRNLFTGSTLNPNRTNLAWIAYDGTTDAKALYVAQPATTDVGVSTAILRFDTFRQAWSVVDTPGRFNTLTATTCLDTSTNKNAFIL
ncbi:tail tube protein B, partial [Cyanophage BHS3]